MEQSNNIDSMMLTSSERKYLKIHKTLSLQLELVPTFCWYANIRNIIKKKYWNFIRHHHYNKANNRCEICGRGKSNNSLIHCHEVWHYHERNLLQKLSCFQALCEYCHEVKHYGLAKTKGNEERAFRRFKKINKLDNHTARNIINAVFKQWQIRSQYSWSLNINILKKYNIDPTEFKSKKKKKKFFKS